MEKEVTVSRTISASQTFPQPSASGTIQLKMPPSLQYTSVQTLSVFTSKANSPFISSLKLSNYHFIYKFCFILISPVFSAFQM